MNHVSGNLVNIFEKRIYPATVYFQDDLIIRIDTEVEGQQENGASSQPGYILPGFIDAHVHIESSMLVPAEFARMAVVHGTVGTVSDPHEVANVCGVAGVEYMIRNGEKVPFKFNFGAPSCVPATTFETAGASIDSGEVATLLSSEKIKYLSEMMNFPGVLMKDEEVIKKIEAARRNHKPVDGHAPGLRGEEARRYIEAGISTDHECFTREEALEKLQYGMKILIREGSAAKNFEALADLLNDHAGDMMLCSDDKHPDSLYEGHINQLCARAIAKEIDVFNVLQAACVNPVLHYKLGIGLLREGDAADFIIVEDLINFKVRETYIDGKCVAKNGVSTITSLEHTASVEKPINNFNCSKKNPADFIVPFFREDGTPGVPLVRQGDNWLMPVIEALEGQLITNRLMYAPKIVSGNIAGDPDSDILKLVIVNRYKDSRVAQSFIKNFGLKKGAIASSVAHDSHNIVAVGADDESICRAVNLVIQEKGGISCVNPHANENDCAELVLPLPVAGLMSAADGYETAKQYTAIDAMAKGLGSLLAAPFMTLSFMALLVIPHLKLSDKGLFDGDGFRLL